MNKIRILFLFLVVLALVGCKSIDGNSKETGETPECEECNVSPPVSTPTDETNIPTKEVEKPVSPLQTPSGLDSPLSPLPTPESMEEPGVYPLPTRVIQEPTVTPEEGSAAAGELVLLHTNDTWGYYDPCG